MALLLNQTNGGKDLTYKEYVQLLSHAASNYNNNQIPAKGKRQVYQSNIYEDNIDNYEGNNHDYEPFDIDTPVETIKSYAANYCPNANTGENSNRVRIPRDRWLSLDDKTRTIWDSFIRHLLLHLLHFPLIAVKLLLGHQLSLLSNHGKRFYMILYKLLVMTSKKNQLMKLQYQLILSQTHLWTCLSTLPKVLILHIYYLVTFIGLCRRIRNEQ
jgi:hypothetical protein